MKIEPQDLAEAIDELGELVQASDDPKVTAIFLLDAVSGIALKAGVDVAELARGLQEGAK